MHPGEIEADERLGTPTGATAAERGSLVLQAMSVLAALPGLLKED